MHARGNANAIAQNTFSALLLAALAFSIFIAAPACAEPRYPGEDRWVPAFAITGGYQFQKAEADVTSECQRGGPNRGSLFASCSFIEFPPAQSAPLRPADEGTDWTVSPYFGADIQFMTPALTFIPGRPRFFVSGNASYHFPTRRQVAVEGDGGLVSIPLDRDPDQIPGIGLEGVGSNTTSKLNTLVFGANIGIAFPFELLGKQIWIKPSLGWIRYGMSVEGNVSAGIKDDRPSDPQFGDEIREVYLWADKSPKYNAIGPVLELEMNTGKVGQMGVSLFMGGGAYKVLGDRDVDLYDTEHINRTFQSPLGFDDYDAWWSHEVDPWIGRINVGIRFSRLGN